MNWTYCSRFLNETQETCSYSFSVCVCVWSVCVMCQRKKKKHRRAGKKRGLKPQYKCQERGETSVRCECVTATHNMLQQSGGGGAPSLSLSFYLSLSLSLSIQTLPFTSSRPVSGLFTFLGNSCQDLAFLWLQKLGWVFTSVSCAQRH